MAAVVILGLGAFWALTRPQRLAPEAIAAIPADPVRGEYLFRASGCADCHASERPGDGSDPLRLGGGRAFATAFGTFYAPNISPDPVAGIGAWRPIDMVNALRFGVSPRGRHYYPAFPYPSYARMTVADAVSLAAYLATLPPVATPSRPHELRLPFRWRRTLGLWKLLYMGPDPVVADVPAEAEAGRYLAEALAHCGACHTPRGWLGGSEWHAWLTGGPDPVGPGTVPDITPGGLGWSEADLITYLQTGFTPEFRVAGGDMALVIRGLATLPARDIASLAAYLRALPARPVRRD